MNVRQFLKLPSWMHAVFGILESVLAFGMYMISDGFQQRYFLLFAGFWALLMAQGNLAIHVNRFGWVGKKPPEKAVLDAFKDDPEWRKLLEME